ncbi:ABC transporter substrate-binding protein [Desulfobulbus oralis]|uniref:Nitrate ABC transporter substrate-binding protein n=1 Tax=Desulfobulbus oralis TaxID=1986146 RepID=A0A2L1GQ92_9BACT|nr:ABC transporter substrate-binding protein [Desulfobulbus oralis]AVD71849.1 nitrate ABC transporter substrate-binding protein [Desulfobulbus oralis]
MLKKLSICFFAMVSALVLCSLTSAADKPMRLKTAWMDEHETFLIWYAHEKGWDKEVGLDLDLLLFSNGMDIVNALPAGEWVFCGNGAVPAVLGALRYGTEVILIGNDESYTNAVMVRADSPIAKTKGYNKDFPDVLGHPDDVRGKTFLITTMSSDHYAFSSWLQVLGLTDKDVIIKNMDQAQAVAAYEKGIGDGVALWAPHMYRGEELGWKIAGTVHSCKKGLPIVLMAEKKFAEQNPETVAAFLSVYLRAVNMLKTEPLESLVPEYKRFFLEFTGKEYSDDLALKDLQTHPVFNLEEQKALFDDSKGQSTAQRWQGELAKFFTGVGKLTQEECDKVGDGKYANGKYLNLIKEIKPYK